MEEVVPKCVRQRMICRHLLTLIIKCPSKVSEMGEEDRGFVPHYGTRDSEPHDFDALRLTPTTRVQVVLEGT